MSQRPPITQVARIDGRWLITSFVGAIGHAEPVEASAVQAAQRGERLRPSRSGGRLSRGDNPARPRGRPPAGSGSTRSCSLRSWAPPCCVVAVGLLGLRVLGQSNDRVGALGELQKRASAYGTLQSDATHVRPAASRRTSARDFYKVNPGGRPRPDGSRRRCRPGDRKTRSRESPRHPRRQPRLRALPQRTERSPSPDPPEERSAACGGDAGDRRARRRPASGETILRRKAEQLGRSTSTSSPPCSPMPRRAKTDDLIAPERERLRELAEPLHRRRGRGDRPRAAAGVRPLMVADRPDPADRHRGWPRSPRATSPATSTSPTATSWARSGANVNRMNDELRRLYRELEAASRHKSEFLANMSHELRTPLNAILGFSQVLRERMFGEVNAKQEEYLDDILSSGHHLLSLINDVLDLSKVEAGQVELEVAPFSLREALERGVVMVRERATRDGVQVGARGGSGGRRRRGRRAPDQAGDLQPALERREVHARGRGRRRERGAGQRRGEGLGGRHRSRPRRRGSRADLRGVPADRGGGRAARGNWPRPRALEAASSSCTAAGSGSTASSARGARSCSRCPRGRS